ncbi:GAF domain-containing protein [Sphingomonas immobilis]|uniref:GAF domain-containing protein n=1 Tax=Sphingomonas immobilis TaxID=3063997 RepID=A0ABT9A0A3_9SPHN|nr:GAF domain-containing protein [Sphingomonas sp. CA1-15]MDO7842958.1 GAF domain-containing protein [Sphingomonas sp. CA1-15]
MDELAQQSVTFGDDTRIRAILKAVCDMTGMGFAAVSRVTDTRWIACQVLDKIGFGLEPGEELDLKTTICDEIREGGKLVVIDHVGADADWRTHHTPMMYGFESYVSIPIVLEDGSFFGTLCAIDPEPRALTSGTIVATMQGMAQQVAAMVTEKAMGKRADIEQ